MTTEECRLSYYKKVTDLKEEHRISLVKHAESDKIYVMKELVIYNLETYCFLQSLQNRFYPDIFDYFEIDGKLILIEEFINGNTLEELVENKGTFSKFAASEMICSICDALSVLHSHIPPIVHRDIKPSNVMISNDGMIKIIDLNTSKLYDDNKTEDTMLIGTRDYAAPEQYGFGQSDARTDIYACGVLLNYLVTGKLPKEQLAEGGVGQIVEKCIKFTPEERYQSVRELKDALSQKIINSPKQPEYPKLSNETASNAKDQSIQSHEINASDSTYLNGAALERTAEISDESSVSTKIGIRESSIYKRRHEYWLPGFRSGRLVNMLVATAGYAFMLYLIFTCRFLNQDGTYVSGAELIVYKFLVTVLCAESVAFATNYLEFRNVFPFQNHKSFVIRILAGIAEWILLSFALTLLFAIFISIFFSN